MKGKLVVFEGPDGAGKTTQINACFSALHESGAFSKIREHMADEYSPLVITRQSGGTRLGVEIRSMLLDPGSSYADTVSPMTEAFLFSADRRHHVETFIKPALEGGSLVLCDRYTWSTLVYQGYVAGQNITKLEIINEIATVGIDPDLTIYLRLDAYKCFERAKAATQEFDSEDRFLGKGLDHYRQVVKYYDHLRECHHHNSVTVDASLEPEKVTAIIMGALTQMVDSWGNQNQCSDAACSFQPSVTA